MDVTFPEYQDAPDLPPVKAEEAVLRPILSAGVNDRTSVVGGIVVGSRGRATGPS